MSQEFLKNHKGHQVPLKAIRPADIIRHEFVQSAIAKHSLSLKSSK